MPGEGQVSTVLIKMEITGEKKFCYQLSGLINPKNNTPIWQCQILANDDATLLTADVDHGKNNTKFTFSSEHKGHLKVFQNIKQFVESLEIILKTP